MTTAIRLSDADSLNSILSWLKLENDDNDVEGFYDNRNLIRQAHKDGSLWVLTDDDEDVAFTVGDESTWDILEVRPNKRGCGYGRKLAQHCIEQARSHNVCVLKIECSPRTSIPFWKRMGFKLLPGGNALQNCAYLVLDKSFPLPDDRPEVSIEIGFYPERIKWEEQVEPVVRRSPRAVQTYASEILLADRVICFDPHYRISGDPVVRIKVAGNILYSDKAKYSDAELRGVCSDNRGTFYLDRIKLD